MRADARANRQDLLAAAGRLIATQGAAMSLRGVAQEAGVGVGHASPPTTAGPAPP